MRGNKSEFRDENGHGSDLFVTEVAIETRRCV